MEHKNVWVFLEVHDGELRNVGPELLGQGRILADKLGEKISRDRHRRKRRSAC